MKYLSIALFVAVAAFSCKPEAKKEDSSVAAILKDTLDPAIAGLSDSISKNPNDPELFYRRANYYLSRHDLSRAKADVTRMMSLDSTKSKYLVTYSDFNFISNKTSESKRALEKAVSIDPKNIDAHLKLAELFLYVRQYKQSLAHLDEVIALDKYNAKAYFLKGMDFKEVGDTGKAISSMETTIEQDPEYYNAWMQLGLLHGALGNPIAVDYYDGALKLNPRSTEALYNKGLFIQEVLGNTKEARKVYQLLLNVDSLHAKAWFNVGYLEVLEKQDFNKALDCFMRSYKYDPEYADAVYMMGYCEERLNKMPEAISDYKTALAILPTHYQAKEALMRLEKGK